MRVDVAVVGGGIVGLSAAWRLAMAGHRVLVVERFDLAHARGSSHGATRLFRFAYDDPVYVRMAMAALPLWRELEADGEEVLRITGGMDVGDDAYLDRLSESLASSGAVCERLSERDVRERAPWLRLPGRGGVWSPDTGVIAAEGARAGMARHALRSGAEIWDRTLVSSLTADGDEVTIETERGSVRARRAIVAAGAWASTLLEPAGISLPLQVTREHVFYFRGPIERTSSFIDRGEVFRYGVPRFGDAPGMKVAEHQTGEVVTPDERTFDIDPARAARVSEYVRSALPDLDPEPVHAETCLYTMTPDEDFVLEAVGPVIVASPCSGHGFKFAPLVGEVLARLATGREPPVDLSRFRIGRFGG